MCHFGPNVKAKLSFAMKPAKSIHWTPVTSRTSNIVSSMSTGKDAWIGTMRGMEGEHRGCFQTTIPGRISSCFSALKSIQTVNVESSCGC